MPVMSAPTQKMYGLPVIAMNAGSAAVAAVIASSSDFRPAGPKLFGFLWSKPLSRVIRATGLSSPGTFTERSRALVTTSLGFSITSRSLPSSGSPRSRCHPCRYRCTWR